MDDCGMSVSDCVNRFSQIQSKVGRVGSSFNLGGALKRQLYLHILSEILGIKII